MSGRVVLVTGATHGVGRGIVEHVGTAGGTVVVADWQADRVERTVADLQDRGIDAHGAVCNVLEPKSTAALMAATLDQFDHLDAVVATGAVRGGPITAEAAHDVMKPMGWGRIVHVGGTKEVVTAFTREKGREWARDGIVLNAIAPGKTGADADLAEVSVFLCSDACRHLTGQVFLVDRGDYLWA